MDKIPFMPPFFAFFASATMRTAVSRNGASGDLLPMAHFSTRIPRGHSPDAPRSMRSGLPVWHIISA
jgi:hypothetical protein